MAMSVGDHLVERLKLWGVERYGYPGHGINGIVAALDPASADIVVQVRHEEQAAFIADPRLIFMVSNNRDLDQVSWETRIESGVPKFPGSQEQQGLNVLRAFAKGDPDEAGGIVESVGSMVAAVLPTHHPGPPA